MKIFRTVFRRSAVRNDSGRSFHVLDPWEADRFYRDIHRGYDAVFQAGQARISLQPTKPLESSHLIPVSRLVRPKAFFVQFDGFTPPADSFEDFDSWAAAVDCGTHRDCRVLPHHMFSPSTDWQALETEDQRQAFEAAHGGPTHLHDEKSRPWNQTNAWHGNDTLEVARFDLPTGFHWDVVSARNTSRMSSLTSAWRFDGKAYLNISPDGFIRAGQSKGATATKEDEAPRPAPPEPATPSKRERDRARRERQRAQRRR
ncbi:hypothetical protein [Curtobacterium sp. MCPF17_046]|uniref:hypothetical protein n=1 Tax=Curtobacterium sp. MCPF17_046 TaxID=2175663 RepID=UPI000D90B343|nr:hypothetical protein [Curtobacterium sp. MCPF17_046]PYY34459.1 hypothetical protein DEJ32_14715 [Curtobacterium sp. MCPF17_046]